MLAFLAAVVPILASIYAGGSYLLEATRLSHDARVYVRVKAWYDTQHAQLDGQPDAPDKAAALKERRDKMLTLSGVDPSYGTLGRAGKLTEPIPPRRVDLRRQWALLLGAIVGVILLAVDQIP